MPSGQTRQDAVIDATVTLEDGVAYEVAALGSTDDPRLQVLPIDTRPLPGAFPGCASSTRPPMPPAIDFALLGGEPVIADLEPGRSPTTSSFRSPSTISKRASPGRPMSRPIPGILMRPNTVYSIYVIGLVEDGSLTATLVPVLVSPDIAAATPVA